MLFPNATLPPNRHFPTGTFALSSSGLALGLVPTQLNISSVTLHRFLEHLKNQFTPLDMRKGCHTGHRAWAGARVLWLMELLLGHTLQAPPDPSLTHPLSNTAPSYFRTRSKLLLSSVDTAHISLSCFFCRSGLVPLSPGLPSRPGQGTGLSRREDPA